MRIEIIAALLLMPAVALAETAGEVDLERIDRKISKEPAYVSDQPLYGLVVFGRSAEPRIWMVLDKSEVAASRYDVLYADINGNGDLTEDAERFVAGADKYGKSEYQLPTPPGQEHAEFRLRRTEDKGTQMISVRWNGKHKLGGGYPEDPENGYLRFGTSAEQAPIMWLNGDGPFRFQRWYSDTFPIGGQDDLKVFLGLPGLGESSFCSFQEHVLPAGEGVLATLIYQDQEGGSHEKDFTLDLRC